MPLPLSVSLFSVVLQSKDLALTNWVLGDSGERLRWGGEEEEEEREVDGETRRQSVCARRETVGLHAWVNGWMDGRMDRWMNG